MMMTGATLNIDGSFTLRAEKVGADTMLSQIVQMVVDARRSKAPMQKMADVVAGYFVMVVVSIALITFFAWGFLGAERGWVFGLINAVSVLIIACPCVLGLATPMSILIATGRGAAQGILFRDAAAIETLQKVDTLVIDKTGTLTEGKPRLTLILPSEGFTDAEVLRLSASLELGSEHPLASALVSAAKERGLDLQETTDFRAVTGQGVRGRLDGRELILGNAALLRSVGADPALLLAQAETHRRTGASVLFLAIDGRTAGALVAADNLKPTTVQALREIRAAGLHIIMATGDAEATAALTRVGLPDVEARQMAALSGGQFQRVLLARALLSKPQLLILDEPTQGLDQPGEAAFYRLIADVRRETGAAVLMVSHDLHVVMAASDRVICLNGHICCEGTPRVVSNAPEYRALFGLGTQGALALYQHQHDHSHDSDHGHGHDHAHPHSHDHHGHNHA